MTPTLPRRLAERAVAQPDAIAMQEKRHGIWHAIRWAEYAAHVRDVAHGLAGLGVRRGDAIGVLGDNRPEWLITELAAQCLGAAVVGIHPASPADEVLDVLDLAQVRVVVAEDQEQVDKLVRPERRPSKLAHVIYYEPRGLEHYRHDGLVKLTDVIAAGRRDAATRAVWLDGEIAAGDAADPAVLHATSGSTGQLELVRYSHASLLAMADQLHRVDPQRAGQRYVSVLPLAWLGEQMFAVACGLAHGLVLAFPEDPATQRADLREIGPDLMFGPPRIWESMQSSTQQEIDGADWFARRVFGWAYRIGKAVADCRMRGEKPGPGLATLHLLANAIGLRPVRDRLGLLRIAHGYAGGDPSPEVLGFFHAIGVSLTPIRGPIDLCGATARPCSERRVPIAGAPRPGIELRIADDRGLVLGSPGTSATERPR